MNEQELRELNKKLAEWAGFTYNDGSRGGGSPSWTDPTGMPHFTKLKNVTDFPDDLNACFKWLVPKLHAPDYIKFRIRKEGYMCEVRGFGSQVNAYYYENPALALCLAIEKLIDKEE